MNILERNHIKQALEKRMDALARGYRQNIGIIGPAGLGKTHLLTNAYRDFSKVSGLIPLYISADAFDYEQLIECWTGALLSGVLVSAGQTPGRQSFQDLCRLCETRIPKTLQAVHHLRRNARKEKNDESVRELLALSGVLSAETGQKIVLIIDEFHELDRLPAEDPFALLGKEIMVQTETMYLVASSRPERAKEIFRDKLSLLFGNFEVIEMHPFHFQETSEFLKVHFPRTFFTTEQKKFFMTLTGGEPLYLDLLADRLKFYISSSTEQMVSDQLIFLAFQEELFDRKGRLSLIFENLLQSLQRPGRDSLPCLRALLAISEGHHKLANIASYINCKITDTNKILQRLIHEERISKKGSFYLISDPLFRFWMKEVFKKRSGLFTPDERPLTEELYEGLRRLMERISQQEKKDPVSRLEGLFKEFRNEVVEIEGKKWRCPQFQEIVLRPGAGRFCTLIAKGAKGRWVCQISAVRVLEDDVLNFTEETKRLRKKIQRKIIIALGGIDQNAKLMAQTAKIQLWELRDFNALLELFDQPKIVLIDDGGVDGSALGAVAEGIHSS